jgi:hypothetical protein
MNEKTRRERFNMHRANAIGCLQVLLEEVRKKEWEEGMNWGHVGDIASMEMRIQAVFESVLMHDES